MLDSDYKASDGCRGVGRLLWLKAFDSVRVDSDFKGGNGTTMRRSFNFTAAKGVEEGWSRAIAGSKSADPRSPRGFQR